MNEVSIELGSGRQDTLLSAQLRNSLLPLLKRLSHEPLLHFLLIGITVFAVYAYMHRGRGGVESSRQIVLSLNELQQMDVYFVSQWHHQPAPAEFQAMVEDKVREEVIYREGLAMGLDKDDPISKAPHGRPPLTSIFYVTYIGVEPSVQADSYHGIGTASNEAGCDGWVLSPRSYRQPTLQE